MFLRSSNLSDLTREAKGINMQCLPVVVNTEAQNLSGSISLPEGVGLSDFLNGYQPNNGVLEISPYIKLTNAKIHHADGREETTDTVYINRQTIIMLQAR